MMHAATPSGGGYSAASAIHINLFGPHSIVVHASAEQKQRWLVPLVNGEQKACFGVTEPDAGLDTTSITTFAARTQGGYVVSGRKMWTSTAQVADKILVLTRTTAKDKCARPTQGMTLFYTDLERNKFEVRRIRKMGRNAVDSNAVFIDALFIPDADCIGEEGEGFSCLLDSLNPERILVGIEAIGLGRDALDRQRVVFGHPIGQNQGIQHPLAEAWTYPESAYWMCLRAGWLYDQGLPCGAEANAAKFLAARAAFDACTKSVLTHGGMGYAREYQVERLFRESMLPRIAPVTEQLILSYTPKNPGHARQGGRRAAAAHGSDCGDTPDRHCPLRSWRAKGRGGVGAGRHIPGPRGDIRIRIYRANMAGGRPVVMFFRGSGFVLCSIDTHDAMCRQICNRSGTVVVSVDYRLAPENKFPAAPDDCFAATQWVTENAAEFGGDPARLAVCGDSVGGTMAAVTALRARDAGGPKIQAKVLLYPVTDFYSVERPSAVALACLSSMMSQKVRMKLTPPLLQRLSKSCARCVSETLRALVSL